MENTGMFFVKNAFFEKKMKKSAFCLVCHQLDMYYKR